MLHKKARDEEEPVMNVTNRKVFKTGIKTFLSIWKNLKRMAVNVAVLFPTLKL